MRKIEHILFLALVVGALLLANSGCTSLPIARADELTDVGELQREVQLLNFLNGLELSADQMRSDFPPSTVGLDQFTNLSKSSSSVRGFRGSPQGMSTLSL